MTKLQQFWHMWKRFGQAMGDWVARIVLTIFYFTIFAPFGLGVRLFGDPLDIKVKGGAHWAPSAHHDSSLDKARRLY